MKLDVCCIVQSYKQIMLTGGHNTDENVACCA
uniref:Uncharacterized protein n=1 Tax=Parascaris equorum TaxID=6256 RepID=A0A914RAW2_PAREQ